METKSKITVRYAETDQMGIAHHSVYPIWFEVARTDYVKQFGVTYTEMEKQGVMMPLTGLSCSYGLPAKYEDELEVSACPVSVTASRITFKYTVTRLSDGAVLSSGETMHGFVDSQSFRPVNVKKRMPKLYSSIYADVCAAENSIE